jgi:hypothetical protein
VKRLVLAAAVVAVGVSVVSPASADPAAVGVYGTLCGFGSGVTDSQTGYVTAGPAYIADGATPPGVHSGYFICTVQVDAPTHEGPDAAVVGPDHAGSVAVAGPVFAAAGLVRYTAGPDSLVYLCTEVVVDGQHLYYADPGADPALQGWFDTSPSVSCSLAAVNTSS